MRIGIDGNSLTRPFQHGTRRYLEELLTNLAKIDKKNEYIVFAAKKVNIPKKKNFKQVLLSPFPVFKRQVFLPFLIFKERIDVFHNIDPYGPVLLFWPKITTTVHDLDLGIVYPSFKNLKYFAKRLYSEITRYFVFKNTDKFITVSRATSMELSKYIGKTRINTDSVLVYESSPSIFSPGSGRKSFHSYYLCMADFSPRKNIGRVFEAYSRIQNNTISVSKLYVIVSTQEEANVINGIAKKIGRLKGVEFIISPDDSRLRKLYRQATAFVFPSLYEGFGLPILEAMACGCPVITSNRGATKEISGGAAILVNPESTNQIAKAMKLCANMKIANRIRIDGLKQSKSFSWIKTANETLSVYNKALAMPKKGLNKRWLGLVAFLFLSLFLVISFFRLNDDRWSTYVINGRIVSNILSWKNYLVFGSSNSKLFFLNSTKKNINSIDLNSGNVLPRQIVDGKVLVTSDDTLRLVDIKTNRIIWQRNTGNQVFFVHAQISGTYILAATADGHLYSFRLKDGKEVWRFSSKPLGYLNSVLVDGNLKYYGSIAIVGREVYIASHDKTLYSLKLKSGELSWQQEIGDTITVGPTISNGIILVGTKSGSIIAVSKKTGEILWKTLGNPSPVMCVQSFSGKITNTINFLVGNKLNLDSVMYELHKDGTLIKRDVLTGRVQWKYDELGKTEACPAISKSHIFISGSEGNFVALSLKTGKKIFENKKMGRIIHSATILPRFGANFPVFLRVIDPRIGLVSHAGEPLIMKLAGKFVTSTIESERMQKFLTEVLNVFSPGVVVHNTNGDLWLLNAYTGKAVWDFRAGAPTENEIRVQGHDVLLTTTEGLIYKINLFNGFPRLSLADKRFSTKSELKNVGTVDILELSLATKAKFTNPWLEAELNAVFIHDDGTVIPIPGFYYDQNIWKVRFNPPKKGVWKWKIYWKPHGGILTREGSFNSLTDTSKFYLRISSQNPRRLTSDGKHIFNGLGLGDTVLDYNYNGTPLDDWAIANSDPIIATNSSGHVNYYKSDRVINMDEYIKTYGPGGAGFNLFRWSLSNASQPIYLNFGYPTIYSILQGKIGDDFVHSLKSNGIHIWLTLFGFDIPYKDSSNPADKHALRLYIRNMYARYGAYIDVWELANEMAVPKETANLIREELSLLDHEKRPISISSNTYNLLDGDIIAPHWYETENISDSDSKTWANIVQYNDYKKPVVFTEQGNLSTNFDSSSGVRMRIRAWTAFIEQGVLMFWNQSDSKAYTESIFPANLYLGPDERKYTSILQQLSMGFPLNSSKTEYRLDNFGVRGYGILSEHKNLMYFFHAASPGSGTLINTSVFTENGGNMAWIDPATGEVIAQGVCNPGKCNILSPVFKTDIVLTINSRSKFNE